MIRRQSWLQRLIGEVSVLRRPESGWSSFGRLPSYRIDQSRVDYALARRLYRNTDDKYKLGAGFAKPIVNALTGFIAVPQCHHPDADTAASIAGFIGRWHGTLLRLIRNTLRDGDAYARLAVERDSLLGREEIRLSLIPPEWVRMRHDPITGAVTAVVIDWPGRYEPDNGSPIEYMIRETITPTERRIRASDKAPRAIADAVNADGPNPWGGVIPIIHCRNEAEEYEANGTSELEPLEPYFRVYHDVAMMAAGGAQLFSRPKVKLRLKNVSAFLAANFSEEERASRRLDLNSREIFVLGHEDDAGFVGGDSGIPSVTALLELIYLCIVDTSEIPEFVFGGAVSSSKASVSEQMVPFIRRVEGKRGQLEEPLRQLIGTYLALARQTQSIETMDGLTIIWPEVSPRDERTTAEAMRTAMDGVTMAIDAGIMSRQAGAEYIRQYVPTMLPWTNANDPDGSEAARITQDQEIRQRLADIDLRLDAPDADDDVAATR